MMPATGHRSIYQWRQDPPQPTPAVVVVLVLHSRRESPIQLSEKRLKFVAKKSVGLSEAAVLAKPAIFEVTRLNLHARGDVLGHAVEPFALLGGEGLRRVALDKPSVIARTHFLRVRQQCQIGHEG